MAKVSVLYIRDEVVAPHLELLRNICEPTSRAKPHVTVRFFNKLAIPETYLKTTVSHVDLLGPGAYLADEHQRPNRTVFMRCQAEDLLHLEHKPQFPTSEFHITLYDGYSDMFAKKLFGILNKYRWGFRVPLPENSLLKTIELKSRRVARVTSPLTREYPAAVRELFNRIAKEELSESFVLNLTDRIRLRLAELICDSLHRSISTLESVSIPEQRSIAGLDRFPEKHYDIHLTPPELAQDIASFALGLLNGKLIDFGDPAVGTGAFYSALLTVSDRSDIRSAMGVDISPKQVEAAKWRWRSQDMEIREGDYLHMDELPSRNLILANPPYLRHQKIPSKYKLELRQRASVELGFRISALSGQYVYFIILSHRWMAQGAIAAWLIPSEFMQTDYGKALRYYFSKKVQLVRIHRFSADNPQFENAEVLPCVVVFKNLAPKIDSEIIFSIGGTLNNPAKSELVNLSDLNPEQRWSVESKPAVERDENFLRLGDLFAVKRGIATGANEFFVMDRQKAIDLDLPDIALKPILPKAMLLKTDIIKRRRDGYPSVDRQMCVLDCDLSEEVIRDRYPSLMSYLNQGKNEGVLNGYLVSRRSPWFKQEQREPAPFLCTYMGKAHGDKPAIRFLRNKSDAIATNTYLLLYPHPAVKALLKKCPELTDEVFAALKESSWNSVNDLARSHAGGLLKIEPKDLEEVWLGPLSSKLLHVANKRLI